MTEFDLSALDLQLIGYALLEKADRVVLNTTRTVWPLSYKKNRIYVEVRGRKKWLVEAFQADDVLTPTTSGTLGMEQCQRLKMSGFVLLWVSCKAHLISTLSIDGAAVLPNAAWPAFPKWSQTEMLPRLLQSRTNFSEIDLPKIAEALHSDKGFFAKDAIEWPVGVLNHKHTLLVWGGGV